MREILFRGKRVDNGEWVYGYYFKNDVTKQHYILKTGTGIPTMVQFKVIPESVSQSTNLLDKNGEKIFEGDILKGKFCNYVIWFDEAERAFVYGSSYLGGYKIAIANYLLNSAFNIIGNIHDNPELLEVQQ